MSETVEKIKLFRATIKEVSENFKQPLGHPCLIAKLDVCEKFMAENNDKSIWGSYGRGSVRHFTNDLLRGNGGMVVIFLTHLFSLGGQ